MFQLRLHGVSFRPGSREPDCRQLLKVTRDVITAHRGPGVRTLWCTPAAGLRGSRGCLNAIPPPPDALSQGLQQTARGRAIFFCQMAQCQFLNFQLKRNNKVYNESIQRFTNYQYGITLLVNSHENYWAFFEIILPEVAVGSGSVVYDYTPVILT